REILRWSGSVGRRIDDENTVALKGGLLLDDRRTDRKLRAAIAAQPLDDFGRVPDAHQEVDTEGREGTVRRTPLEIAGQSPVRISHPAELGGVAARQQEIHAQALTFAL